MEGSISSSSLANSLRTDAEMVGLGLMGRLLVKVLTRRQWPRELCGVVNYAVVESLETNHVLIPGHTILQIGEDVGEELGGDIGVVTEGLVFVEGSVGQRLAVDLEAVVVQEELPVVDSGHLQLGKTLLELLISQHGFYLNVGVCG